MGDVFPAPAELSDRLSSGQLSLPGTAAVMAMPLDELAALIEALLLVSAEPPTIDELSAASGAGPNRIDQALDAIIAYRQPVTRVGIEAVRGVDCSGVISTLHARGLIEPVSRQASVGNPFQYGTTAEFLKHFGLGSLADLPPLGTIDGRDAQAALEQATETVSSDASGEAPAPPGPVDQP